MKSSTSKNGSIEPGKGQNGKRREVKLAEARLVVFPPKVINPKILLIQLLDAGVTYRLIADLAGVSESALRHIANPSWRRSKDAGRNYMSAVRMMSVLTQLHNAYVRTR